jgi:hypothetical protein
MVTPPGWPDRDTVAFVFPPVRVMTLVATTKVFVVFTPAQSVVVIGLMLTFVCANDGSAKAIKAIAANANTRNRDVVLTTLKMLPHSREKHPAH